MTPEAPDTAVDHRSTEDSHAGTGPAPVRPPLAAETRRLYQADWQAFETWCEAAGLAALPADPASVAGFLSGAAGNISAGTLARRVAAIREKHRQRGLVSPAADPAVRAILRTARRNAAPCRPPPPRPAQLRRMAAACPGDFAGARDRALLLLAAAGLSRATLVGLDVDFLRFIPTAVVLTIRDTGPDGDTVRRLTVPCSSNPRACPVQALRDWLHTSETQFGPVFRKIDRWGNVEHRRLGTDAIRRVLARRTPRRARHGHPAHAASV